MKTMTTEEKMNSNPDQAKTISGFLASALQMEDEMSESVYGEFLLRENWPASLDEQAFINIKEMLSVLISDTERHKKIFSGLLEKINGDTR